MPESTLSATLPRVVLRDLPLSLEVLRLVPLSTVEKYQVAAFEVGDQVLKLAIVHPEQLKQGFYTALKDIGARIGKKVELFQTDAASMQFLIRRYKELSSASPSATSSTTSVNASSPVSENTSPKVTLPPKPPVTRPAVAVPKPPLFELGKTVAFNYLKRIPLTYGRQHRLACVDFLAPSTYWFLSDLAEREETKRLVETIAKQNEAIIHILPVKKAELDDLFDYYQTLLKREEAKLASPVVLRSPQPQASKPQPAAVPTPPVPAAPLPKVSPAPLPDPSAPTNPEEVVVPNVQATILSQREELGGIAGIFQRVTQNLTPKKAPSIGNDSPEEPRVLAPSASIPPQPPSVSGPSVNFTGVPVPPPSQAQSVPVLVPPPAAAQPAPVPSVSERAPVPTPASPQVVVPSTLETQTGANSSEDGDIGRLLTKSVESLDEFKDHVKKGSVPRIVAAMINYAIHEKASDVHLETFEDEVRVRYRIDGQLVDVLKLPPDIHAAMVSRIKILSKLRLDETRVPQDGRFDVKFENAQVDLRVSIMPTVHGEKVVMRILDKNRGVTSLESLGIEGLAYQNILKAIEKPYGICLATGPTGSGKSTSLYAILKQIATPNVNVVTLEDPVEFEMKGVNQSQIRPKIGFTFADGLRAILRQDPNIIMVGEIRDGETANMATQAALTGHLVLSTLHTNDSSGAIPRLENMGIEPFLIASSLNVVIGQRLVRRICPHCKSEVSLPGGLRDQFTADVQKISQLNPIDAKRITEKVTFYQGMGCDACRGKGYQGRLGIYEVLVMSEEIEDLTLKRAPGTQIQEVAQKQGMLTMYQDGLLKVLAGQTTLDEVLRESTNK